MNSDTVGVVGADLREKVVRLLNTASSALDEKRYRDWVGLFTTDGTYVATSAENRENNWPLAIINDNRATMADRAEMIDKYWSIEPGRSRRITGNIDIDFLPGEDVLKVKSSFVIFHTGPDGRVQTQVTGVYYDTITSESGELRLRNRTAVHDNDLLTHEVTYPF
ncbi:aromatic-ring-hydroxylating dioxygenase subunit beta [Rhodococcus sp. IEGM 1307]|uniref:aromatic-ring-hydroxylating dioxygenase subunit beta n=1 Tax=Rhodococcus sp. IEGM 1307 TaxID=3047091 RepID=UPI0024B7EEF0|nr:aromatic-ring-hydroxylating dioxygenase subunit beta [Rhodococcus sp. IEGM 1307]MDI9973353.1 aromatic-ring-hydroxylating dioxygenase subunit beta [Rhodococcus sp. IEGM 1307]